MKFLGKDIATNLEKPWALNVVHFAKLNISSANNAGFNLNDISGKPMNLLLS